MEKKKKIVEKEKEMEVEVGNDLFFFSSFFDETIIKTLAPIAKQERFMVKVGVPRIQQGRVMGWPPSKTSKSGGGESQSTATAHTESSSEISHRADNQPEQE